MKKLMISAVAAVGLTALSASATETWILTKANKEYQVDTVAHATVGPGTTLTELVLKGEYLIHAFYTTVDLNNKNVELRALKAGDNRSGLATVPNLATSHDIEGEVKHFAGVNSDFFSMQTPYYTNGNAISNGNFISPQNAAPWAHWMLTKDNLPIIAAETTYAPYVTLPGGAGTWYFRTAGTRYQDYMMIYPYDESKGEGQTTEQNKWGSECVLELVDGGYPWTTDREAVFEVVVAPTAPNTTAGIEIPKGKYVLSGNGKAAAAVGGLKVGDRLSAIYTFKADGKDVVPVQMSGGNNILIKDGVHIDINSSNAPRTFIGMNKENDKVVMMVIDGRQDGWSAGTYYRLGAAIMEKAGCYNALEFDGGGSSTMYVSPLGGVVNRPSEGSLRRVAAGLYATAVCPDDWNVTSIEVKQKNVALKPGETFTPVVYGYNRYGVLIDNNVTGYTLEAPAALGTVSTDGKTLTAAEGIGYQPLTVKYGLVSATIPVKLSSESGVVAIEPDDAEAPVSYYNLQGVEVSGDTPGLYIVRRGAKVTKEIVK